MDPLGTVDEVYDYDPMGVYMEGRMAAGITNEQFAGGEWLSASLYSFGARKYMAAYGRWNAVDALADSFPSWNAYNYVLGNPVGFTDPLGLSPCSRGQIDVGRRGVEDCRTLVTGGSIFGHFTGGPVLRGIKTFIAARLALRGAQAAGAASAGVRALSAAELGIQNAKQFQATMSVVDDIATVRVGMVEAAGTNPFTVIRNLERLGRQAGVSSVRVEGTIANELLRVLERRFGAITEGFTTHFNIPIRREP